MSKWRSGGERDREMMTSCRKRGAAGTAAGCFAALAALCRPKSTVDHLHAHPLKGRNDRALSSGRYWN